MKRKEKIKALQAFAKGHPGLLKELTGHIEKPLFITCVLYDGLYYADFEDMVFTKDQLESYTNGNQLVWSEIRPFANKDFNNKHLPEHLKYNQQAS